MLHGLERDQQNVDRHFKLQHVDLVARQHEDGGQQIGLLDVDFVSQLNLLLRAHAVDVDVRLDHHGLREQGHGAASHAGCHRCGSKSSIWLARCVGRRCNTSRR